MLLLTLFLSIFAQAKIYTPLFLASNGGSPTCALDNEGLKCWKETEFSPYFEFTQTIQFKDPTEISIGEDSVCAIDQGKAVCVDKNNNFLPIPKLEEPTSISTWSDRACAIAQGVVTCWESPSGNIVVSPTLNAPVAIRVMPFGPNNLDICATDHDGLSCWKWKSDAVEIRLPFQGGKSIAWDNDFICVLGSGGAGCFVFIAPEKGLIPMSGLKNPRHMADSFVYNMDGIYFLDDEGIKQVKLQISFPSSFLYDPVVDQVFPALDFFKKAKTLSVGAKKVCGASEEEVQCGSGYSSEQIPLALYSLPHFHLDQLTKYFGYLEANVPAVRGRYFSGLRKVVENELASTKHSVKTSQSRYLALALASAPILNMNSEIFVSTIIPAFNESISAIDIEFGFKGLADGLAKIPDGELNRKIALTSIQASVEAALEFMPTADRAVAEEANRSLGQALAGPMDNAKIKAALGKAKRVSEYLEKHDLPKVNFLIEPMQKAVTWLLSKVG